MPSLRTSARPRRVLNAVAMVATLLLTLLTGVPGSFAEVQGQLVPDSPRGDTPYVVDGEVLALAQVGDRVLVGGSFTKIRQSSGDPDIVQPHLFAYDVDTGLIDPSFTPDVHRTVRDLEAAAEADTFFVAGDFNSIDGITRRKVAKMSLDGTVDATFVANAIAYVNSIVRDGDALYVGGAFSSINGVSRSRLAAVSTTTGVVDPGFDLPLTEGVGVGGWMEVKAVDIAPGTGRLFVAHSARKIAGQTRTGVAVIDTAADVATLASWRSDLFEDNLADLGGSIRMSDAAVSPDGSFVIVGTSGGDKPPTNDVAIRFPMDGGAGVEPDWVSRHFDSVYAVDVSDAAVYVGGHFRFQEAPGSTNPFPGDPDKNYGWGQGDGGAVVLGDEVVAREQVGALDPLTGKALPWNPGANGQEGVLELELTPRGLLLGHDGILIDGQAIGRHGFFDLASGDVVSDTPLSEVLAPLDGQTIPASVDFTFSGTAEAQDGVDRIKLEVQEVDSKDYLNPDGSLGDYAQMLVTIDDPGAQQTSWSYTASLPVGDYVVRTRAFDLNGIRQVGKDIVKFQVRDFENAPPDARIVDPADGSSDFLSNSFTVSGTAEAGEGVAAVKISILDENANAYVQADGSLGDYVEFDASLTSPGTVSTGWSFPVTLVDGTYRFFAKAVGSAGGQDDGPHMVRYLLYPGNAAPAVAIDAPLDDQVFDGPQPITISGTATDDAGVDRIYAQVFDLNANKGLGFNGFYGSKVRWFPIDVDDPGALSTTWSWTAPENLPLGHYRIRAYARDVVGVDTVNVDRPSIEVTLTVPGDDAPVMLMDSPANAQQVFASNDIVVGGTATDDQGVTAVGIRVWHYGEKLWAQPDGSLSVYVDIPATLSNPGATSTTWSVPLTLPDGKYRIEAQAFDTVGQHDELTQWGQDRYNIWLFPGDALPTASIFTPTAGQVIAGTTIGVGGEILDDRAVQEVEVYLRHTTTGRGPRINGSIGNPQWVPGFVTNPGHGRSNFNFTSIDLPPGTYDLRVRAIDDTERWSDPYTKILVELTG